jgi:hypothetical protein
MEANRTSEKSIYSYETTQYDIPEGCNLHTSRHENLKSYNILNHYGALQANTAHPKYETKLTTARCENRSNFRFRK